MNSEHIKDWYNSLRTVEYLPKDWAVIEVFLKDDMPRILGVAPVFVTNAASEEWFTIPNSLAYFLLTHWSGTDELRNQHRREMANEIKQLLLIGTGL